MILGHGIDLVNQNRIDNVLKRYGEKFETKYFSNVEVNNAKKARTSTAVYAKCWAAKEAFSKAVGTGIRDGLFLKDISLVRGKLGKPEIKLNSRSEQKLNELFSQWKNIDLHVSISDEIPWIQASVIIYGRTIDS